MNASAVTRYELFYTATVTPLAESHGRRLQRPSIPFYLAKATFDERGSSLGHRNVTQPQDGMGYVSLSPDGVHALFATERETVHGWKNVDTFIVPLDGSAAPRPLFADESPLLAPCASFTPPCTQASTFHAVFAPDGKTVIFAYRVWSSIGAAVGSQALAMADTSGRILKLLTYDPTAVNTQDMCPTPSPSVPGALVFVRSLLSGEHSYVAELNTSSGRVTVHKDWPAVGDGAGCPAALRTGGFMYLGCAAPPCDVAADASMAHEDGGAERWGQPPRRGTVGVRAWRLDTTPRTGKVGWAQLHGREGTGEQPTVMFNIGLTKAPGYVGVFTTSQCDRIWGDAPPANDSIICQGASPDYLFFLKDFVDPRSGRAARNDTQTLQHVMTPRPYALRHVRVPVQREAIGYKGV